MPALKSTKTEENLKAAFAGESQANRRYLYFAQKADVAPPFRRTWLRHLLDGRWNPESFGEAISRHQPWQPLAVRARPHAELGRIERLAVVGGPVRKLLEFAFRNHQQGWAQPATGDQSAYEQSVVIAQAVRPYGDLHLAVMQLRATLGLHRDIGVVGAAVDEAVDASVGQGQEDV